MHALVLMRSEWGSVLLTWQRVMLVEGPRGFLFSQLFSVIMCSTFTSLTTANTLPHVARCRRPRISKMDGHMPVGPLPLKATPLSRYPEERIPPHHLIPRLTRTRSLPLEHRSEYHPHHLDAHRRDLLASGIFLTAAVFADSAAAGQSNSQLAER